MECGVLATPGPNVVEKIRPWHVASDSSGSEASRFRTSSNFRRFPTTVSTRRTRYIHLFRDRDRAIRSSQQCIQGVGRRGMDLSRAAGANYVGGTSLLDLGNLPGRHLVVQ